MNDDPLLKDIDKTATALLSKCRDDGKLEDGNKTDLFIEQVKAFQAVTEWAKVRHAINPPPGPEKEPSPHERLRAQFNGPASQRRRAPRASKGTAPSAGAPVAADIDNGDIHRPGGDTVSGDGKINDELASLLGT